MFVEMFGLFVLVDCLCFVWCLIVLFVFVVLCSVYLCCVSVLCLLLLGVVLRFRGAGFGSVFSACGLCRLDVL